MSNNNNSLSSMMPNSNVNSGSFVSMKHSIAAASNSTNPSHANNNSSSQPQGQGPSASQQQHIRTNSNLSATTMSSCSSSGQHAPGCQASGLNKTAAGGKQVYANFSSVNVSAMAASLQVPSKSRIASVEMKRPAFFHNPKCNEAKESVISLMSGNNMEANPEAKSCGDDDDDAHNIYSHSLQQLAAYYPVWRGAQLRLQSELNRFAGKSSSTCWRKKSKGNSLGTASMDASLQLLSENYAEKFEITSNIGITSFTNEGDKQLTTQGKHRSVASYGSTGSLHLVNDVMGPTVTPLYACDDMALPCDADLGSFETREEEQSYMDIKKEQEQIGKVVPNIFGVIKCPCPAWGVDDSSSWKSRLVVRTRGRISDSCNNSQSSISGNGINASSHSPNASASSDINGWWDQSDQVSLSSSSPTETKSESSDDGRIRSVVTKLQPTMQFLKQANLPATLLHPATYFVNRLPFLSDRLPTHKHIQIETQTVTFSELPGEIEPMFCSLSIYHIEGSSSGCPVIPRCSRISEILHFDVVSDPIVEELCSAALWPRGRVQKTENNGVGTNCGVFALPSSVPLAKLFGVVIVKKILSEEPESEFYTKPLTKDQIDLSKSRAKAAKSSEKLGQFLMPFAFGIIDLKKAIEDDSFLAPKSMMVQIPLFKIGAGQGDNPIIERILAMQTKNRNASTSVSEPIKGGKASFVLRYFDYLGIQAVVDSTSSLAPDRLIDSSGSVQIRRVSNNTTSSSPSNAKEEIESGRSSYIVTEEVSNGGRELLSKENSSNYFAQELCPLPLQLNQSSHLFRRESNRSRSSSSNDCEQFSYTSYMNDLLCRPHRLHGSNKRNIVIKIEHRRCTWDTVSSGFTVGPPLLSIYNQRRGQHLVASMFSSCAYHVQNPLWNEEFKVRLPDSLDESDVLLLSVYNVCVKNKRKTLHIMPQRSGNTKQGFSQDNESSEGEHGSLELLGCGILPLLVEGDDGGSSLLESDNHDVILKYTCRPVGSSAFPPGTLVLEPFPQKATSNNIEKDGTQGAKSRMIPRVTSFDNVSKAIAKVTNGPSHVNEILTLQVRIFSLSSVHSQNPAITKIFSWLPRYPLLLSNSDKTRFFGSNDEIWRSRLTNMTELLSRHIDSDMFADEEEVRSVFAGLSKTPPHELSAHLFRIIRQVWRRLLVGTGEPSLLWADPAALVPLRLQCFSTLLHIVNAAASFQAKSGLTELDGNSHWDLASLGCLVALILDEESLFVMGTLSQEAKYVDTRLTKVDAQANSSNLREGKTSTPKRRQRNISSALTGTVDSNDVFASMLKSFAAEDPDSIVNKAGDSHDTQWRDKSVDSQSLFDTSLGLNTGGGQAKDDFNLTFQGGGKSSFLGLSSSVGPRKYMTIGSMGGPKLSLATISEKMSFHDNACDDSDIDSFGADESINESDADKVQGSSLSKPVKQMRIPRVSSNESASSSDSAKPVKQMRIPRVSSSESNEETEEKPKQNKSNSIFNNPEPDGGMLDMIGKQIGAIRFSNKDLWGEERLVGTAHTRTLTSHGHRKLRNMCSIDLSLPAFDKILEDEQQLEDKLSSFTESELIENKSENVISVDKADSSASSPTRRRRAPSDGWLDFSYIMKDPVSSPMLRDYTERLSCIQNSSNEKWWPYIYEVLIYQWVAMLVEQTQSGDKEQNTGTISGYPAFIKNSLSEAAKQTKGITIGGAPLLFEIIKKSLSWRVSQLFVEDGPITGEYRCVSLDAKLLNAIEHLISMVTDACIDSRNFDSYVFRKTSIDVNDSVVRFLRDLFAIVSHEHVHRLILVYFSRFVMKGGKHWQDRDSKIGLRCSWEVCKLRLNAVTLLVRFPDLVEVNRPMMKHWEGWSFVEQTSVNRRFFTRSLDQFLALGMANFAASDGPVNRKTFDIPERKPHWLIELITDICLASSDHADQNIQLRGSSLLHELFWNQSQEGKSCGNSSIIASMHVPFIPKVLGHLHYLSSLPSKSQLRKDIMPCVVFVLQSAPSGLLRALWRKLCKQTEGVGDEPEKYGGFGNSMSEILLMRDENPSHLGTQGYNEDYGCDYNILDLYCLLNLALMTLEYEGNDRNNEGNEEETLDQNETWKEEFLEREEQDNSSGDVPHSSHFRKKSTQEEKLKDKKINTTASRRWNAHDCALVICQTSRYVIDEVLRTITTKNMPHSFSSQLHLKGYREENEDNNPNILAAEQEEHGFVLKFSVNDTIVFVRAVTTLYLHILSLRQSDIVVCKTIIASVEILKIFGIKVFLVSVGDTLQHWMRIILCQCGARRANVRVQALEFLALLLRLTWDTYGSFARVRIPLLAIQMEVMERIVATAASRFYREQRLLGKPAEFLPNNAAEAALSPLWRTLDRMHKQSASKNVAFKTALERLAEAMKKLHAAYIAAHALALANRLAASKSVNVPDSDDVSFRSVNSHTSNNLGRQFLGLHVASSAESVAHNEAVEDAFLAAANVFKPTELPSHRVAWLRKLADFHSSRNKYGEEATCRFHIYQTLRQCAAHYDSLWNPSPFLPWAGEAFGYQVDGEGPANSGGSDLFGDELSQEFESGNRLEKVESFRKMFYRAASSVRMRTGDWDVTGNKNIFYGVCTADEYSNNALAPWFTLREIEEEMVEEIEIAGDLFLKANIEDFSRKAWTLAAEFYSQSYNYPRLCQSYLRLSQVVTSHVPIVDTSNQIELSSHFGRFYRVWFHGSAPDELNGKEFIYRTHVAIRLEEFGNKLVAVLKSLLPEGVPIDLVLDDGRPEMHDGPSGIRNPNAALIREKRPSQRRPVAHVTAGLQPIRDVGVCQIKITPLRPMLRNEMQCRGSLEWFYLRTEKSGFSESFKTIETSESAKDGSPSLPSHRISRSRSTMGSISFPGSGSGGGRVSSLIGKSAGESSVEGYSSDNGMGGGVDTFSFTQPKQVDRRRGARDWLRTPGDFTEKSLKVTKLMVPKSFPTFVSRQRVSNRSVYKQSPLEAGVEAICSWCSVLFRTVVATNGRAILRGDELIDHGIGRAATKVVADCIHCARVKEMAQVLLKKYIHPNEEETHSSMYGRMSNDRLSAEEVIENQIRLARGIVIYMELLHLLIARNRDILLRVVKQRRQNRGKETPKHVSSDVNSIESRSMIDRTNDSIAVQSELQRAFIAMAKALYPIVSQLLPDESPSWLRLCSQDGYFSSGIYQQATLSMSEELIFDGNTNSTNHRPSAPSATMTSGSILQTFHSPFVPRAPSSVHSMTFGVRSYNGDGQANSVISGDGRSYVSG